MKNTLFLIVGLAVCLTSCNKEDNPASPSGIPLIYKFSVTSNVLGNYSETYLYDAKGMLVLKTNSEGDSVIYNYSDSIIVEHTYDKTGKITKDVVYYRFKVGNPVLGSVEKENGEERQTIYRYYDDGYLEEKTVLDREGKLLESAEFSIFDGNVISKSYKYKDSDLNYRVEYSDFDKSKFFTANPENFGQPYFGKLFTNCPRKVRISTAAGDKVEYSHKLQYDKENNLIKIERYQGSLLFSTETFIYY